MSLPPRPISIACALLAAVGCAADAPPPLQPTDPLPDAAPPDGGDVAERILAARTAAATDPACTELGDFFWEVGDAAAVIVSGSIGSSYAAETRIDIASGSKWIWGAYVVERFRSDPSAIDRDAITMRAGYTSMTYASCVGTSTVAGCFLQGDNDAHTPAHDDLFHYGSGHFQKQAVDLGLGTETRAGLANEIDGVLGGDLALEYSSPQTAAGAHMAPADYARFLRRILSGQLAIAQYLGRDAVCTLPSDCPQAISSPVPERWLYSYGHWVETDGALSSPGYFGFYPWIDAGQTVYGLLARHDTSPDAYFDSVECGRAIRQAFAAGAMP